LAAVTACAFGDLFESAGPGDVRFVWVGDTVLFIDSAVAFDVTLLIDGVAATSPEVHVEIPDSTVISFHNGQDSIIGSRPGFGDVVAWIESSLAPRVDTVFRIRSRP
jgi:hypothetical protein